jgi:hypothetical protein
MFSMCRLGVLTPPPPGGGGREREIGKVQLWIADVSETFETKREQGLTTDSLTPHIY